MNREKLKEILFEMMATSPTRDYTLETNTIEKEAKRREVFDHIEYYVEKMKKLLN